MVTVDTIIRQLESFDRAATIEELLEKPKVVDFLREAFDGLSPKSKTIARNISSKTRTSSESKSRCTSLVAILEVREIALPEEVQIIFNGCKENPSTFWSSVGIRNNAICFTGCDPIKTVASQAYIGLTALNTQRKWDTITWRYYTLFFYDLILLIGDGKLNLTAGLHRKLLEVLHSSPLITDAIDIIENNLNKWITAGSRYSKFCTSLGDGALFLLPPLSDSVWEDSHSLCGSAYNEAVQHLIDLKISKLSTELGADALGTNIRATALNPFRWSVETFRLTKNLHGGNASKSAAEGGGSSPDAQHSGERARKRPKKSNHTLPGQQTQRHFPAQPAQPPQPSMAGTGVRSQTTGWYSTDAANLEMLSTAASVTGAAHQISTHGQVDPREQGTQAAHHVLHPSARSSSIVDQSDPTPPEARIPFRESALCSARWSIPNHTDLYDLNDDPAVAAASQQLFDFNNDPAAIAASQQLFDFNNDPAAIAASQQLFDFNNDPAAIAASQQLFDFNNDPAVIAASQQIFDFNNDPAVIAASQQIFDFNNDPAVIAASQQLFDFNNDPAVIAASQQFFDFNYDPAVTAAAASQQLFDFNNDVAVDQELPFQSSRAAL